MPCVWVSNGFKRSAGWCWLLLSFGHQTAATLGAVRALSQYSFWVNLTSACLAEVSVLTNPWSSCLSHPFWGLERTFRSPGSCGVTGKRQSTSRRSSGLSSRNAHSSPLIRLLPNMGPSGKLCIKLNHWSWRLCSVTQGRLHCFVGSAC